MKKKRRGGKKEGRCKRPILWLFPIAPKALNLLRNIDRTNEHPATALELAVEFVLDTDRTSPTVIGRVTARMLDGVQMWCDETCSTSKLLCQNIHSPQPTSMSTCATNVLCRSACTASAPSQFRTINMHTCGQTHSSRAVPFFPVMNSPQRLYASSVRLIW